MNSKCLYCGSTKDLETEHLVPRSRVAVRAIYYVYRDKP